MQIEDNSFHVVQTAADDYIVQTEADAIDILQNGAVDVDPDSEDVSVIKVDYERDDWTIQSLPWQRIALKLLSEQ